MWIKFNKDEDDVFSLLSYYERPPSYIFISIKFHRSPARWIVLFSLCRWNEILVSHTHAHTHTQCGLTGRRPRFLTRAQEFGCAETLLEDEGSEQGLPALTGRPLRCQSSCCHRRGPWPCLQLAQPSPAFRTCAAHLLLHFRPCWLLAARAPGASQAPSPPLALSQSQSLLCSALNAVLQESPPCDS